MELYLFRDHPTKFSQCLIAESKDGKYKYITRKLSLEIPKFENILKLESSDVSFRKRDLKNLKDSLLEWAKAIEKAIPNGVYIPASQLELAILFTSVTSSEHSEESGPQYIQVAFENNINDRTTRFSISQWHDMFQGMIEICGSENLKIDLAVKVPESIEHASSFEAKELPITKDKLDLSSYDIYRYRNVGITTNATFEALVTAKLLLNVKAIAHLYRFDPIQEYSIQRMKNRSNEKGGVCTDVIIIAANGEEVKCHKDIIGAESEVFKAMFENEMLLEGQTGCVEMSDMSEAGVRALLAAIYDWDFKAASADGDIALELLRSAHKYLIYDLIITVSLMICEKPSDWFNVGMAVELILYLGNITKEENCCVDKLIRKAVTAIQWYSEMEPQRLLESVEYQEFLGHHSQVALEHLGIVQLQR